MSAWQFYITTLLVYAGVDMMLAWGLNLQYGLGGMLNLGFVMFQAVGGYAVAVLTLGSSSGNGGFEHYIGGASLPFPLSLIAAGLIGAAVSAVVGVVVLYRLRSDYLALALLVVAVIASDVVIGDASLFNGTEGLSLIPQPLVNHFASPTGYAWVYVGWTAAICLLVYLVVQRVTRSPFGRVLRAARDNEDAVEALGRNVFRVRLTAFALGGGIAALAGGVLVQFISAWSPGSWFYSEGVVLLAAVVVGGPGNNLGVIIGALLVPVAFGEISRLIPQGANSDLIAPLQGVVVGLLILAFLWLRPKGILPERAERFRPDENVDDGVEVKQLRPAA